MLDDDGKKSAFNSPQNVKALQLMVDGIKDGGAPKAVTTYMEPETDQAWTSGKYDFMRNWTYAYAADQTGGSKVKGKYAVAPLPSFEGAGRASILGGHNSVISRLHEEPGPAAEVLRLRRLARRGRRSRCSKYSNAAILTRRTRSGRQEGGPVRGRAQGALPGEGPPGLAGVSADLAGDLQERQRRSRRSLSPADAIKKASSQIDNALSTF